MGKVRIVRQYGAIPTHGSQTPVRIVIHTTEGDSASPGIFSKGYGAHYVVAADGTIYNYVPDNQIAYGTGGNNTGTIDIEIVGHAKFSAAEWAKRAGQIRAVSSLIGLLTKKYKIPVKLSTVKGISTHAMNSKIYSASEGHWDPGPGFPLKQVLTSAAQQSGTTADFSGVGGVVYGQSTPPAAAPPSTPTAAPDPLGTPAAAPTAAVPTVTPPTAVPLPTAFGLPGPDIALPGSVDYTIDPKRNDTAALWGQVAQGDLVSPETQAMLYNAQLSNGAV